MEEQDIYENAVMLWGKQFQTDMMIEESTELIKAILKNRRGKATDDEIISEMVDCQIMLNQMRIIMKDESKFSRMMAFKLDRLQGMIERELKTDLGKMKQWVQEDSVKREVEVAPTKSPSPL